MVVVGTDERFVSGVGRVVDPRSGSPTPPSVSFRLHSREGKRNKGVTDRMWGTVLDSRLPYKSDVDGDQYTRVTIQCPWVFI